MSYKTRRYKEGLSGEKPSGFYLDEEGHRAQEAGYRDYLRNQDLAEQIRQSYSGERRDDSDSSASSPAGPPTVFQRVFWGIIGVLILYLTWSTFIPALMHHRAHVQDRVVAVVGPVGALLFFSGLGIFCLSVTLSKGKSKN